MKNHYIKYITKDSMYDLEVAVNEFFALFEKHVKVVNTKHHIDIHHQTFITIIHVSYDEEEVNSQYNDWDITTQMIEF